VDPFAKNSNRRSAAISGRNYRN